MTPTPWYLLQFSLAQQEAKGSVYGRVHAHVSTIRAIVGKKAHMRTEGTSAHALGRDACACVEVTLTNVLYGWEERSSTLCDNMHILPFGSRGGRGRTYKPTLHNLNCQIMVR